MKRLCFLSPFTDPFYNLAAENWLLTAEQFLGCQLLFLYRNRECIVIGRNQNVWAECNVQEAQARGVPILRRFSGGGAVIHDLGNWNYSLHVDKEHFTRSMGAELILRALDPQKTKLFISPRHDIYSHSDSAKISGSAYKITKNRAYHHGTVLINSHLDSLLPLLQSKLEILAPDSECPFGGVSSVRAAKVANFDGCSVSEFPQLISRAFGAKIPMDFKSGIDKDLPSDLSTDINLLKSWEWIFGKSPPFKVSHSGQIIKVVEGLHNGKPFTV